MSDDKKVSDDDEMSDDESSTVGVEQAFGDLGKGAAAWLLISIEILFVYHIVMACIM